MIHFQVLKRTYIAVYKFLFNFVYKLACLLRKYDQNKVVISLYREEKLSGNLKFVYEELLKQLPNVKVHLIYAQNKMNLRLFKEIITIANAKYLILDDFYLPIYLVKPRKSLKVIQLWHAAGAFKKFGYSTIGTKFGPDINYLKQVPVHSNYTHVYVSSDHVVKYYAEAFNMSVDNIYPLGIARIDMFNDEEKCSTIKDQLIANYPKLQRDDTVKIFVAPTYRAKGSYSESTFRIVNALIEILKQLSENKLIIYKPHPYMDKEEILELETYENVLIVNDYSINEWMLISDAFITDYSSSIFEYALLQKPLAHFVPDIDQYKKNRGFYEEIEVISDGDVLQSTLDLLQWIEARKKNEFFDTSRMIKYNFSNTQNVSEAIVKHFLEN